MKSTGIISQALTKVMCDFIKTVKTNTSHHTPLHTTTHHHTPHRLVVQNYTGLYSPLSLPAIPAIEQTETTATCKISVVNFII